MGQDAETSGKAAELYSAGKSPPLPPGHRRWPTRPLRAVHSLPPRLPFPAPVHLQLWFSGAASRSSGSYGATDGMTSTQRRALAGARRGAAGAAARTYPAPHLRNLVLVACHSVYTGLDFHNTEEKSSWFLLDYHKVCEWSWHPSCLHASRELFTPSHRCCGCRRCQGRHTALWSMCSWASKRRRQTRMRCSCSAEARRAGVALQRVACSCTALSAHSAPIAYCRDAGPRAEGEGYWLVAEAAKWYGNAEVRERAFTEARHHLPALTCILCCSPTHH